MTEKENIFSYSVSNSTGFLLYQTQQIWQRELKRKLKPLKLTHTQFVVLANSYWLDLQKKEVPQIEIAKNAKMDTMMVSNVIKKLIQKDLINRIEHPIDTRAKIIELTSNGFITLKKAVVIVENFDSDFFNKLKDVNTFNQELLHLIKN